MNPQSEKSRLQRETYRRHKNRELKKATSSPEAEDAPNDIQEQKSPEPKVVTSGAEGGDTPKQKIPSSTAILMIGLALFFDGLQFFLNLIPFVGNALSSIFVVPFAWLSFYVWFKIRGVDFVSPKRSLTLFGAGFLELIPILNVLPAWTLAVVALIITTRIKKGLKISP